MLFQLEEKIREKVNEEYKSKITLQAEQDLFVRYSFFIIVLDGL